MNAREKRRQQLFDAYAANLSALPKFWPHAEQVTDTFVCPSCRARFGRDALNSDPPTLTIEHCIPTELGGTMATITLGCADCNNTAGSRLDAQIKKRFGMDEFFEGISDDPLPITLELNGTKVTADWRRKMGDKMPHMDLVISKDRSDPKHLMEFADSMKTMGKAKAKVPIRMTFKIFRERQANIAFLRMGFLMMFRQFGYSYILNPCVDRIRRQIREPDKEILPDTYAVILKEMPSFQNGVMVVHNPPERRCFMVALNLKTAKKTHQRGIIMPGLHDGADQIYELLEGVKASNESFTNKLYRIPYEEAWLHDPSYAACPYRIWYEVARDLL